MSTLREQAQAERGRHKAAVRSSVAENASCDSAYVVMNVLATVVATYGLLSDSAAVVIGAMIIAMLLGPISGVGLALVDGDNRLLWKAASALLCGVLIVLGAALVIGFFNQEIPASREMMMRTEPNIFDLMIALGGGAAGAYAVISPRLSVVFVGVAIATALVPPLLTCSLFLVRGEFGLAAGAFLLALANIVAIQFASSVVFFVNGFHEIAKHAASRWEGWLENGVSVAGLLILGGVLLANLHGLVRSELYKNAVHKTLQADLVPYPGAYLADVRFTRSGESTIVRALVRGPTPFSAAQVADMERTLPPPPGQRRSELWIRYVHTMVMSGQGPVYVAEDTASELVNRDPAESLEKGPE